tara:strand:+ start:653 stop:3049 length:2397 start_codon:yes stop_codon:yes gene_type:complete
MKLDYDNAITKLHDSFKYLEDKDRLDEGAWETIKYGLSKLGRYKAGGKLLGKNKTTKAAQEKIRAILNKESNKLLRGLDSEVSKVSPEFPNDKKRMSFLRGIITIGTLYDSIVSATNKKEGEEGYLPIDAANEIISDMREYVKKSLDVDLAGVYTTMESKEGKENVLTEEDVETLKWDVLTEEEVQMLDEKNFLKKAAGAVGKGVGKVTGAISKAKDKVMDKAFGAKKGSDKPSRGGSGQSAKMGKTSGSGEFESDRMGKKGLASNRLPILLNMVGGAMGAYSWLANTEWFKSLFQENISYTDTEQVREVVETKSEMLTAVKPGDGVYKLLNTTTGIPVDANSTPQGFISQLEQIGGGDAHKGIDLLCADGGVMMRPSDAAKGLHTLVDNPQGVDNMGEFFKAGASGTGKLVDPDSGMDTTLYGVKAGTSLRSILIKSVPVLVTKFVTKTAVKTGAAYYTAKGLGNILGPIGLALVLAGVTVKVLREKGQRQSRAKTLDDLLQSLKDIKPTEENPPIIELDPLEDEPQGDEPQGDEPQEDENPPITPDIPADFLQGNRNMQLVYLSQNFLPNGKSLWGTLGLKQGTVLPSGFFDASLGQGKVDKSKYLNAFYNHLNKNNSFNSKISSEDWMSKVNQEQNQSLIKWVRNTRKGIGSFFSKLKNSFPEDFAIGERKKAKVSKPGQRGKAMGLAGESLNGRYDLINELSLGSSASQAGFDEKLLMKNLPQFMEMLSMMYYGAKGSKLPYNKEAVLNFCKKYGCKGGSSKKYKKTKSDDYEFMMGDKVSIKEEIIRIRQLMK